MDMKSGTQAADIKNRILRRIFGPRGTRMGSEEGFERRNFIAKMEADRSALKILISTPTGKRPLGRPRRRWEDNIRMNLKEICINTRNWVHSAQDRDYWRIFGS